MMKTTVFEHIYFPFKRVFNFSLNSLFTCPAFVLFFMILFLPTIVGPFKKIKAILLIVVLGMITIRMILRGRVFLHTAVALWTLFMVVAGLAFMILGLVNGTKGALRVGTVYVLWPIVYTIIIGGITNENIINGLIKVMVFSTIAIGMYGLSFILYHSGWLPDFLYIKIYPIDRQGISFYEGYIRISLRTFSSLLFLIPFLIAILLSWPKGLKGSVSRFWVWLAVIIGLILVILSARRALILVVVLAQIITLTLIMVFFRKKDRLSRQISVIKGLLSIVLIVVAFFCYMNVIYDFNFKTFIQVFNSGFDFSSNELSQSMRREQFFTLLRDWSERPLFGAGHGAISSGLIRSETIPWAYELSYVALLFHVGIVGFSIYLAGVIWIFWMGLRIIRYDTKFGVYMLPVLVGTSCFLIGNATNPYLEKFDYIWVIFLPVALINYWLLTRRKELALESASVSHKSMV